MIRDGKRYVTVTTKITYHKQSVMLKYFIKFLQFDFIDFYFFIYFTHPNKKKNADSDDDGKML